MNFLNYLADFFLSNINIEDLPVEEFEIFDISISEDDFEDQEIYPEDDLINFSLFDIEEAINNNDSVVYLDDTDSSEDHIYYNLEDLNEDDFR